MIKLMIRNDRQECHDEDSLPRNIKMYMQKYTMPQRCAFNIIMCMYFVKSVGIKFRSPDMSVSMQLRFVDASYYFKLNQCGC